MSDELAFLTIAEVSRLIEQEKLSPVELTTALIQRTQAIDPQLNTYLLLTAERALDQARQAEREIAAGNYRGAMHGIPSD
jgi:aspartyl-tRNA(Asn)/glutamyl-tRNA(Gln) amidotransferase subunit A